MMDAQKWLLFIMFVVVKTLVPLEAIFLTPQAHEQIHYLVERSPI
jgi:hypothetical protein